VKDWDKTPRITGVILIGGDPYHVVSDYWVYHCEYFLLIDLPTFFEQFSDRHVLNSVEIDLVRLVLLLGNQEQEEAVRLGAWWY
jgi:hypothetical protein